MQQHRRHTSSAISSSVAGMLSGAAACTVKSVHARMPFEQQLQQWLWAYADAPTSTTCLLQQPCSFASEPIAEHLLTPFSTTAGKGKAPDVALAGELQPCFLAQQSISMGHAEPCPRHAVCARRPHGCHVCIHALHNADSLKCLQLLWTLRSVHRVATHHGHRLIQSAWQQQAIGSIQFRWSSVLQQHANDCAALQLMLAMPSTPLCSPGTNLLDMTL